MILAFKNFKRRIQKGRQELEIWNKSTNEVLRG